MTNDKNNIQNHLVHSHDVQLDTGYTQWLVELKSCCRSAQIKAAVRVNAEKLIGYEVVCLLFYRRSYRKTATICRRISIRYEYRKKNCFANVSVSSKKNFAYPVNSFTNTQNKTKKDFDALEVTDDNGLHLRLHQRTYRTSTSYIKDYTLKCNCDIITN